MQHLRECDFFYNVLSACIIKKLHMMVEVLS